MIFLCAGILILPALIGADSRTGRSDPQTLAAVEIRSYQGLDLSSVNDFRENSILGPRYVDISRYRLIITGLVAEETVLTYDEILLKYPHYSKVVTLYCVEGWDATILWEGVLVRDLINDAGADPRANTVIFRADDGYTTSLPLEYIMDKDILMAYRMNNVTLPAERGYPFQLVAEDKWGYKWIKWIETIELSDDPSYRGYWEQRGYSDSADTSESFYNR
ncbi:molybdopterin-dependent oxidoreductase [Methanocalculus taiwanensis]|uniref:Molybdopterin-dependent oxidoreductase n=2 Tax=Methanocalculus taiwanensis TaxID=106207 RepID=A0ABD4TFU8_9EURY|nr:molybdopterin-dependent oxidoreductase [Methanocalculus taiwanensis]